MSGGHDESDAPSAFLVSFAPRLPLEGCALDLASGRGRNALWLAQRGLAVTAIDRNADALEQLARAASDAGLAITVDVRDLEVPGATLPHEAFDVIVVCRYLHRPLFPAIRRALRPGGLLVYETYTIERARFKKPTNPAFLLRRNELLHRFLDWHILHYDESTTAHLACRKPSHTVSDTIERDSTSSERGSIVGGQR